ncbi:MAG TPA: toxin-antitoxin system HicB family antitoxin, partial [Acidimicrobiales bacterium]|nr:toxin-antitoxin system HicB family antitoxin [Acidimicrobiales bacterium]
MPAHGQITIRASADLVMRLKEAAAGKGTSMNEYVTHLIEVALDPERATSEDERLVARLRAAGIYE